MAAGEGDKFAEAPGVRGSCGVLACAGLRRATGKVRIAYRFWLRA
jgi:hypothetical protein